MRFTLQEYRDKIDLLEKTEDEKALLRNENTRLRDEMQGRYVLVVLMWTRALAVL